MFGYDRLDAIGVVHIIHKRLDVSFIPVVLIKSVVAGIGNISVGVFDVYTNSVAPARPLFRQSSPKLYRRNFSVYFFNVLRLNRLADNAGGSVKKFDSFDAFGLYSSNRLLKGQRAENIGNAAENHGRSRNAANQYFG